MSQFGKFVLGALVGGAVGAALGMLLAPRSGAETRALIRQEVESRSRQAGDRVKEKSDVLKEKAAAFRDKMHDMADDLEETGRRALNKVSDGLKTGSGAKKGAASDAATSNESAT